MGSNMFEHYYANQLMKGGGDVFQGSVYKRGYGSKEFMVDLALEDCSKHYFVWLDHLSKR